MRIGVEGAHLKELLDVEVGQTRGQKLAPDTVIRRRQHRADVYPLAVGDRGFPAGGQRVFVLVSLGADNPDAPAFVILDDFGLAVYLRDDGLPAGRPGLEKLLWVTSKAGFQTLAPSGARRVP